MVWYGVMCDVVYIWVWFGTIWLIIVWRGVVWYGTVQYSMACCGMVWHGMVWYGTAQYGMAWCGVGTMTGGENQRELCELRHYPCSGRIKILRKPNVMIMIKVQCKAGTLLFTNNDISALLFQMSKNRIAESI